MIRIAPDVASFVRMISVTAALALCPLPALGCGEGGLGGDGGPVWGVADPIQANPPAPCPSSPAPVPGRGPVGVGGAGGAIWGVADPVAAATGGNVQRTSTTSVTEASVGHAAEAAVHMTGNALDSQADVLANTNRLNSFGAANSRSLGTLDTLEGILLLPIDALSGGHLLWSGEQAHKAADQLEANSRISASNSERMSAAHDSTGASAPATGASRGASGGAFESERAQGLFGQLESHYGVNREEFVAAVDQAKGNPGAVGEFMQEKTGDPKLGREAVTNAVDVYVANLANPAPTLRAARPEAAARTLASAEAPAAQPTESPAAVQAAKKTAAEESLRERLRKALLDRDSAGPEPGSAADSAESLEPLREGIFQAAKEEEPGQSLFDVVHTKYVGLTARMRPKLETFGR